MIRIQDGLFALETAHTGYYMALRGQLLEQLHYGAKLHPGSLPLAEKLGVGYTTDVFWDGADSLLHLCLELTPTGKGDYRRTAVAARFADGSTICDWRYKKARVIKGGLAPQGLPGALGGQQTLVVTLATTKGLEADLIYTVYPDCDVITRRLCLRNQGDAPATVLRCMSYQLDLPRRGYELLTFTGAWGRERRPAFAALADGACEFGSETGFSSHYCNPFFLLQEQGAGEQAGRVYGFNLIYSGSHAGRVETGPYSKTRVMAGIQPEGFSWTLAPGEALDTPEAVLTWSGQGRQGVSCNMHRFVNQHILRGPWARRERPVLINNWEATYFNFDQQKLLALAEQAAGLGIELFVLDDGWFGRRDTDTCSLGDYTVNTRKLPGGLQALAEQVKALGMQFGLWVEPEMVSPDSDLYRAHPDWAVQAPGIAPALSRHQLVLDLCRTEVQDYLIGQLDQLLQSADIRYIKWDMNRHISDPYSPALAEQGRFNLAWIKGLYRVLQTLTQRHPEVLFEGCASGGNRFDLGILCYMPQIWTSDDTDAWERIKIQTGTSYGYPQSVMGCHVSATPNHQTLRTTQLESRFDVAAFGVLGYELDLGKLTEAEKQAVAQQVRFYKAHRALLQYGQLYRAALPWPAEDGSERCVWVVVSPQKDEALVLDAMGRIIPNTETEPLRLAGLDPDREYSMTVRRQKLDIRDLGMVGSALAQTGGQPAAAMLDTEQEAYTAWGDLLMEAGVRQKQRFIGADITEDVRLMPDYAARIYLLQAVPPQRDHKQG